MTWTTFRYFSDALGIQTTLNILLPGPADMAQRGGKRVPTLYLLHGLSDDHNSWMRMTSIERYAGQYDLAVVMPAVGRSFYTDMAHGAKYFTFISQELPQVLEAYFPLEKSREGRFAAGLSMGGYGALKLGFRLPGRYRAVASFSGVPEIQEAYQIMAGNPDFIREMDTVFGSEKDLREGPENLRNLAKGLIKTQAVTPKMYISCGTEDDCLPANQAFVRDFGAAFGIEYHEVAGAHRWEVWDSEIERALAWLPLEKVPDAW